MAGNSNLDLTKVDSEDWDKLTSKINTFYMQDSSQKSQLAWHWERNQMMLDGKQWIVFDGDVQAGGLWKKLRVSKQNEYIPRPVTNYLYDIYQTLKGYLIKNKPRSTIHPNTYEYKDKNAAKIGNLVLEANWVRLKEQYNYETAAANLVAYGTVFKKSYWDTSSLNLVKIPKMKEVPITDPTTGEVVGTDQIQETDPLTNDVLYDELPLGEINTTVLEPYRLALDPLAMHLHDARWVMEYSIQPISWIKEVYDREEDGYTGLADTVEEDKDLNGSMRRWFQLRTTSGLKTNASTMIEGTATSDQMVENCAVVKEYYERPSAEYPKGRQIVVAGLVCVYAGPSPYEGPEMGDWHPYSECRWEIVPGRFWGKSPLDDACEIQKQVNSIDSVIVLNRKTQAIPQKLIPQGIGISPGQWTGRPGQEMFYRADGSGAKPETIPAAGLDASVFQERAQRVEDLKQITGAIDILKGDRPPGVNAASALNLLYEVGTGKLFPILDRWKMFVEQDQKKQLRLVAKHYKEPRPDFIRLLKMKNTDLSETQINQFIGADLYDNCNVVVEAGSNIPKLQAAKQGMLVELAQMGMLNLQQPGNRIQFQQDMGIAGYDSDIGPDTKRAEWENDLLDNVPNSPDNSPVVLAVDNHDVHIEIHSNRMKSPAFMALPFPVQKAYTDHIQQHEQFKAQAAQAQIMQQQAMGPSADPGAGAPQPAGVQAGHGKGVSRAVQGAIMGSSDVVTPASSGGKV